MNILLLIILLLIPNTSFSTTLVPAYTGGYPVRVCQPNDSNVSCGGGGSGNVGIGTVNSLAVYTGTTTIGAYNKLVYISGNVGIGTFSPLSNLHIDSVDGNNEFLVTNQGGYRSLEVNGNGTVGIGTTSIDSNVALDVNGYASFHDGPFVVTQTGAGASFDVYGFGNNVGTNEPNLEVGSAVDGQPIIINGGSFNIGSLKASIPFNQSGTSILTNVGIGTFNNNNSALTIMNGNVGIGTWIPLTPLQVVGIGTLTPNGGGLMVTNGDIYTKENIFSGTSTSMPYDGLVSTKGLGVIASNVIGGSAGSVGAAFENTNPGGAEGVVLYDSNGSVSSAILHGNSAQTGFPNSLAVLSLDGPIDLGGFNRVMEILPGVTGLVGIDISPPRNPLDVNGGVAIGSYAGNFLAPTNGLIVSDNVGIGTITPGGKLTIMNGNVGIGTWKPSSALQVVGNVGIGSTAPSGALDMGSGSICLGHTCNSSWPSGGGSNYWSLNGGAGNVGISTTNTVGIGTTSASVGTGLVVMNGNVGIGTWVTSEALQTKGNILSGSTIMPYDGGISTKGLGTIAANTTGSIAGSVGAAFENTDTSGFEGIMLYDSSNNLKFGFFHGNSTSVIPDSNVFFTGSNNPYLFIGNSGPLVEILGDSGSLSLGVSPPINQLDVKGNVALGSYGGSNLAPTNGLIVSGNVGIGTVNPGTILDVVGTGRLSNIIDSGLTANSLPYANASKQLASSTIGQGLSLSAGTISSTSEQTISYQPGLLSAVNANIGVFGKFVNASTVDNIVGSAITFSCIANPTITMYECGVSATCSGPTTIGTVTLTTVATAVNGTVSNPSIAAGDYVGWAITAGTCASIDLAANAQVHSN